MSTEVVRAHGTVAGPDARAWAGGSSARPWERRAQRAIMLTDAVAVYVAVFVAYTAHSRLDDVGAAAGMIARSDHALTSLGLILLWLTALWAAGSRDPKVLGSGSQEYGRVVQVTVAVFGSFVVVTFLAARPHGRVYSAVAFLLGLVLLGLGRYVMRRALVADRAAGRDLRRALVVGSAPAVAHLVDVLHRTPQAGIEVVAACAETQAGAEIADVPVVGGISGAAAFAAEHPVDTVLVTGADAMTPDALRRLAWNLEPHHVDLVVVPGLTDVARPRLHVRMLPELPLVHVAAPGRGGVQHLAKRVFDVVGAALLLVVLAVPLVVVACAIRLTTAGPVLFTQTRIGVGGRPFRMVKLRSMVVGAEQRLDEVLGADAGIFYKPQDDPRVTPIGAFLRRYSIDELPQLFNVLQGSMSLVGPRPQVPLEVEQYDDVVGRRLLVKPGLTGLWQVSGRNRLSLEESVRLDLYYVENWSLVEDLAILARTVKAVVARDGAS